MAYHTTASVRAEDVPRKRLSSFGDPSITSESTVMHADELVPISQQLLSETAHDLQSPLMAVRESLRLVNEEELGLITDQQRRALTSAIQGCSNMQELIDNMLRLEVLQNGMPRVHRQWIDAATITESVASTIAEAGINEDVSILWDDRSSGHHLLYTDPDKLQRLLLNLLRNAMHATPKGGQVMVRTQRITGRGTYHFSVIDRGCGMPPDTLRQLAVRGSSSCGGAGLGLAISRQMASLHFANLEITSRPDLGTTVGFGVPSAGPGAVADSWCRWRNLFRSSHKRPLRRGIHLTGAVEERSDNGGFGQEEGFLNDSIVLTHEGPAPQHPDLITALSLRLAESTPVEWASRLDERLQEGLRMYELAYRAAERRWVVLWDADRAQTMDRIANTNRAIAAVLPALQLCWSNAISLPVGARSTRASIRDLLVRDTLGAGSETPIGDDRRMMIGKAAASAAPDAVARRLDDELRRLTGRLRRQRTLLQQQATTIRPPAAI